MDFIFKTSSLEFPPLSILCVKQDVLTDNTCNHSVFKGFMFWGLTIPDSAKQWYPSDLFLHKQLETCCKLTLVFVYLDGKHDYVRYSNCLQIERIPYWSIFSKKCCCLCLANVFISHIMTKLRLGFGSSLVTVDLFAIFVGIHLKDLISGKFWKLTPVCVNLFFSMNFLFFLCGSFIAYFYVFIDVHVEIDKLCPWSVFIICWLSWCRIKRWPPLILSYTLMYMLKSE